MSREDLYIRHQIELSKLSKGEIEETGKLLERLQKKIKAQLRGAGSLKRWKKDRLNNQLTSINGMIDQFYSELKAETNSSWTTLADMEASWNVTTLETIGAEAALLAPTSGTAVIQAVLAEPYQGAVYNEWWSGLSSRLKQTISANVRQAWVLGETLDDVEKRIGYALLRNKQNAASVIRSGIMDIAAQAREQTFQSNADLINRVVWTSTLDARTSMPCRIRDGKVYTVDGKPVGHKIPYGDGPGRIHWGCRSTALPVLKGESVDAVRDEMSRASFDYNQTTKTRAASTLRYDPDTGRLVKKGARNPNAVRRGQPVETNSTYEQWLKRQPAWVQNKILGKKKAALYRQGNMKLTTFSEDGLRPLTIAQLREKGYEL